MSTGQFPDPKDRDRGASTTAIETREIVSEKPDRPSMLQMSVSALTAISATALLSFVGVWGTVFGMGLLSVLTVLGNYMYSSFIHRTAEKVKQVRPVVPRSRGAYPGTETRAHDDGTRVDLEPVTAEQAELAGAEPTESAGDGEDRPAGRLRTAWRSMVERYGTRRIVLSIVAVFVVLAGTVTVVEMVAGKPLSGIVRNDGGDGTSMFGGNTSGGSGADDSGNSNDPDGEPDQQDPQDGEPSDEEPPADEPQQDEPPADEPEYDEEPPAEEEPEYEEPPADEPQQDEPPADEPEYDEEPDYEEPPAEEPQQDEPPAEQPNFEEPPAE